MTSNIINSPLFFGMTEIEIQKCIKLSKAQVKKYEKNQIIFNRLSLPNFLYVLISGTVAICKDTFSGERGIVTTINKKGDIFGEVYIFIEKQQYDYYTLATKEVTVLEIPKDFFFQSNLNIHEYYNKFIYNMLGILAKKSYYLNQKLQLLSSGNLKKKIAKYLYINANDNGTVTMKMNREEFADFLSVTRPSLSRQLSKMKEEGLIAIKGKNITILNIEAIENLL